MTSAVIGSSPVLDSEVSWTIVSLRERFEAVRRNEVHRVRGRLGYLSSDQEDVVESLSRGIVEKVLQAPVAMLLNAAAANQAALSSRPCARFSICQNEIIVLSKPNDRAVLVRLPLPQINIHIVPTNCSVVRNYPSFRGALTTLDALPWIPFRNTPCRAYGTSDWKRADGSGDARSKV